MSTKNETKLMMLLEPALEKSAWKNISRSNEIDWNLERLEQYQNQLDWELLSNNREVPWTISILEKFQKKIHWDQLSDELLSNETKDIDLEGILTKFEDKFNWTLLSEGGSKLSIHIIRTFADRWDWLKLLNSWRIDELPLSEILEFESYFPLADLDKLSNSSFWNKLVTYKEKILIGQILSS